MKLRSRRFDPRHDDDAPLKEGLDCGRSGLVAARSGLIAIVVAWGLMLSPAPAQAFIYWTSSNGEARANLDGSGVVDPLFSAAPSNFAGLAVGGGYLYWTANQAIGRASTDGCGANPAFVPVSGSAEQDPIDVAVDASHIYWTDGGVGIGRASLDGSAVNENFLTGIQPVTVAVDANYIYWANQNAGVYSIGRANLNGTAPNASFIKLSAPAGRLALDAEHIYWVNSSGHAIGRANLNGTSPDESFIAVTGSPGNPTGVAVDANYVYWSHDLDAIGRANLNGTGVSANFITSMTGVGGLAVDALDSGAPTCSATTPPSGAPPSGSPPSLTPPETTITKAAINKKKRHASFTFTALGTATGFQCELVKPKKKHHKKPKASFTSCSSPKAYKHLKPGRYTFEVRAINSTGPDPTPATKKFKT
jgi:hypothetical protein